MGWLCVRLFPRLVFIYLLHSQQKGKSGPDTTDLKAYLIIYDMNKSSFNAKYAEWIYYAIREVLCVEKDFRDGKQVESVEKQIAGNSWFH